MARSTRCFRLGATGRRIDLSVRNIFKASFVNPGAKITSKNISCIFSASSLLTSLLHITIPPKALCGSVFNASFQASRINLLEATPQGLACFIIAIVGLLNSLISSYAASESLILLYDNGFPCSN